MSTTEQRTGFRLPWGGDNTHRPDADASAPGDEQDHAAEATADAGPAGDGPATDAWPAADHPAEVTPDAAAASTPHATGATAPATLTGARTSKPTAAAPTKPRRDNPLVLGLVRAMREAAETARTETASRVSAAAAAQVEAIHAASAEEAELLKRRADDEIVEIRDWSKAEMARIREETERRISRRRELLGEEVDAHAASVERRIDAVRAAVAEFETRMAAFFERLMQEDDPGMLAGLAEQMPEPPELDEIVGAAPDAAPAAGITPLAEEDAAAAEAEALAMLEGDIEAGDGSDDMTPGELIEDATVAERLATLTTPVRPTGSTADTTTRVSVVGLVSVASISVFKRSLSKLSDVRSVSVSSGPDGDFIFAVTHGPAADLRGAIPEIPGFGARITGEGEDGLTVAARDPEA